MTRDETQQLILRAFLCLLLAGISTVLALLIWRQLRRTENELARIQEVAASCRGPRLAPRAGPHRPPPEDRVQRERPYLGDEGVDISPAMQVRLEYLDESSELQSARVGDPHLLPPATIHIVNLWAVWCGACKEEMPDFKRLFAKNSSEWGDSVRFVAVQVNDLSAPKHAYESWASSMPAKTLRLSDRGQGAPFLEALRGTQSTQPLYFDKLPVTLVLDCNRRVRWAKFERLVDGDLRDLERHVEVLRTELLEVGPNARCHQIWCGNGRCEEGEGTAKNRCEEDCGDFIARRSPAAEVLPLPAVDPSVLTVPAPPCPSWKRLSADGQCVPKLRVAPGESRPPRPIDTGPGQASSRPPIDQAPPIRCGDNLCETNRGEDSDSCCLDCGCLGSFECRMGANGRSSCVPSLRRRY